MLPSTLRWNACYRTLNNLKQRPLHSLSGNITGNRNILALLCDLINLINIDNSVLCTVDIIIRCLNQLKENILYILSHITGFG